VPNVSTATEAAVMRALQKDPAERFQSAATMGAALVEAGDQARRSTFSPLSPTGAGAGTLGGSTERTDGQRGAVRLAGLLVIIALSFFAVLAFMIGPRLARGGVSGRAQEVAGSQVTRAPTEAPSATAATAAPSSATAAAPPGAPSAAAPATAPSPAATVVATPAAVVATAGASTPVQAVVSFYTLAASHEFEEAARLWSPRMRASYPPSVNIDERFADTRSLTVNAANVVAADESTATVAVNLTEVTGTPPAARQWTGTWRVIRGPTGWLLDQPNFPG
jgi:hypothetical protein